ncbi:MAG TPA: HAD hydrolase family protein, partial [archaeon]|nr:HAD hydrolase family protein [archaeon]
GLGIKAEKVDKGLGVRLLAKRLKINLARTAAVGDAENDLPFMLLVKRKGGMAIAPANAEETVKRQADFVTKSRVTQGAIEAMQKIQSARKRFRTWG